MPAWLAGIVVAALALLLVAAATSLELAARRQGGQPAPATAKVSSTLNLSAAAAQPQPTQPPSSIRCVNTVCASVISGWYGSSFSTDTICLKPNSDDWVNFCVGASTSKSATTAAAQLDRAINADYANRNYTDTRVCHQRQSWTILSHAGLLEDTCFTQQDSAGIQFDSVSTHFVGTDAAGTTVYYVDWTLPFDSQDAWLANGINPILATVGWRTQ